MSYVCIKLVSGEELIGSTDSDQSDEWINIEYPVDISYAHDHEGNYGLKFALFMTYGEEKLFTFRRKDIIVYTKPNQNMIKYYEEFIEKYKSVDYEEDENLDIESFAIKSFSIH